MAKRFEELVCWQLANSLRKDVCAICAQENVRRHFRFCDGFTEAAGSVCRNISEGFGRMGSGSMVPFFDYAIGSLAEVSDYLYECVIRGFIAEPRRCELVTLVEAAKAKTVRLKAYHEGRAKNRNRHSARPREFVYRPALGEIDEA